MSKKETAFRSIESVVTQFDLNNPNRVEGHPKREGEIYAHWLKAIQEDVAALADSNLTTGQMYIIGRLMFALVAQASKADPAKPHVKMVAEAVEALKSLGHFPATSGPTGLPSPQETYR